MISIYTYLFVIWDMRINIRLLLDINIRLDYDYEFYQGTHPFANTFMSSCGFSVWFGASWRAPSLTLMAVEGRQ